MDIEKVLVVYKRSTYELYNDEYFNKNEDVKKLIEEEHISVNTLRDSHNTHQMTVDTIIEVLSLKGIKFDVIFRGDLEPINDYDLVITTGGDGTILEASKYIKDIPLLGVNSDPKGSVGFFTGSIKDTFEETLQKVFDNKINEVDITRMELFLNEKPLKELVMNDVLITHGIPAATSRYIINMNNESEIHRSSGIWLSTAAGSTAAIRSAGGFPLPIDSQKFQYLIREFYDRGSGKYHLLGSVFEPNDQFEIISQMRLGKIFIDGPYFEYPFTIGDKLTLKKSNHPLRILGFDNSKRENFIQNHNK